MVKKNRSAIYLVLICFVLFLGARCYRFMGKETLFLDEFLSYTLSTCTDYDFASRSDFVINNGYTGAELKQIFFKVDNSLPTVMHTIQKLHNGTEDPPHTNLYYSLLRFSFWGADTVDIDVIMLRGFLLNLIFFSIGFFVFSKLLLRLTNNLPIVASVLFLAFCSPASIGNTLFVRPYQLQETMFILLTCVFVLQLLYMMKHKSILSWRNLLLTVCVIAFTSLAGYFGLLYIAILELVLLIVALKNKLYKSFLFLIGIVPLVIALVLIIYPSFFSGLFIDRGAEAMWKLDPVFILPNLYESFWKLVEIIKHHFLGVPIFIVLVILIVASILRRKKIQYENHKKEIVSLILCICSILWMGAAFYFAPYKVVRYIMPAIPIFALGLIFFLFFYKKRVQSFISALIVLFTIVLFLMNPWVYIDATPINEKCAKDTDVPLVVVKSFESWLELTFMTYFVDDRMVVFIDNEVDFKERIEENNEVYFIINQKEESQYPIPANYELVEKFLIGEERYTHAVVYRLKESKLSYSETAE